VYATWQWLHILVIATLMNFEAGLIAARDRFARHQTSFTASLSLSRPPATTRWLLGGAFGYYEINKATIASINVNRMRPP